MILWHLIVLAVVQGITEPLPISSSGHLALFHHILGDNLSEDASIARQVDIAVHIGTFFAFLVYFWNDVVLLFKGAFAFLTGRFTDPNAKMGLCLVVASIPAVIAGLLISKMMDPSFFYVLPRLALLFGLFGLLLGVADKVSKNDKGLGEMTFGRALVFGLAQVLALIPGVSRSGITMTAGRFMGFDRVSAAKFSFLMAMIATFGAGVLGTIDVVQAGDYSLGSQYLVAIVCSFVTTLFFTRFLMKWLVTHAFMVFVVYRVVLCFAIFGAIYLGVLP